MGIEYIALRGDRFTDDERRRVRRGVCIHTTGYGLPGVTTCERPLTAAERGRGQIECTRHENDQRENYPNDAVVRLVEADRDQVTPVCDVCGRRKSFGCGHTDGQRKAARTHEGTAAHQLGWCDHYDHQGCDGTCPKAGDPWPIGYAPFVSHAEGTDRYAGTDGTCAIVGPFAASTTVTRCDVGAHPLTEGGRYWLVTDPARGWAGGKGAACDRHVGDDDWTANIEEGDDMDDDEHDDGDECTKFDEGYTVTVDGTEVDISDVEEGDVLIDPAYPGRWWRADDNAEQTSDGDIHVTLSDATCERCGAEPDLDDGTGLGSDCQANNDSRVIL